MKTRYPLIALAALFMLSGCSTPSQLRAQYDVDCTRKSNGEQQAFDTCYTQSKNAIRQRMNFVNPLGAAELAQILEKLDAQKAAFKPAPKPKPLTGEEYQKLVVAELDKRFNADKATWSGQACEVLMSVNADGTIDQIEGTPTLPSAQAAAASVAMADASIDAALANGPSSDENTATPIAPPEIQQQQNGGSLCTAFINTAKASPLPKPPLANGESSFAVSFTYEDDARPQS
ncbi:hypothetical protein [Atlantibacter hermannii]|uniref:hypothetical protein n=1 Tax=Atlantibacter hermannii TaxID=565 RepID=UPI001931E0DC|nr:hypothetical protein [Atlantibacter hermannii]MBL7634320.1 hypothetical protein [Atlantibacter hermannii]MBL7675868.1 hypothetical protein [Atlantibacter hermannii]